MGLGANVAGPPKWAGAVRLSPSEEQKGSWQEEGEKSAGGARGRRRSRRSPKLSGAHRIFKASDQIGRDNFKKVKVF